MIFRNIISIVAAAFCKKSYSNKINYQCLAGNTCSAMSRDFMCDEKNILSTNANSIHLNDNHVIPIFGLGTYQAKTGDEAFNAVLAALRCGYRHIDTAEIYRNEADVGRAIHTFLNESGLTRQHIYVTTKLWPNNRNKAESKQALYDSLQRLNLDYIDLYLIHSPNDVDKRIEQWQALEEMKSIGKVLSIGVSNYGIHHLRELLSVARVIPSVNQIELSPFLQRKELVQYCRDHNITLQAYSPLTKAQRITDPRLIAIASSYNATPAQVLIQWCLQQSYITIPKSSNARRIQENGDVFNVFHASQVMLSQEHMEEMSTWEEALVTGWDPTTGP